MAGEADGMPRIVCRVVNGLERRKTGHADEQDPEQDGGNAIHHRFAASPWQFVKVSCALP